MRKEERGGGVEGKKDDCKISYGLFQNISFSFCISNCLLAPALANPKNFLPKKT
jgi:hypothetical protein